MRAGMASVLILACLSASCMQVVDDREFAPLDPAALAALSGKKDAPAADKPDTTVPDTTVAAADAQADKPAGENTAPAAADKTTPASTPPVPVAENETPPQTSPSPAPQAEPTGLLALFRSSSASSHSGVAQAAEREADPPAPSPAKAADEPHPAPAASGDNGDDDQEISEAEFVGEDEADPNKIAVPKEPVDDGLKHDFVNVYNVRPGAPVEKIAGLPGVEWNNDIIFASRGPMDGDPSDLFDGDNHPFAHLVPGMPRDVVEAANGLLLAHAEISVSCVKPDLLGLVHRAEQHFGHRAVVTSGYRSPTHNRRVRGALHSQHLYCNALDLYMPGVERDTLARYFYDQPDRGGLGLYCHTKSIHVDTGRRREWRWTCRRPG